MTVFSFKKKLTCGKTCHEDFDQKLLNLIPSLEISKNFHTTILHSKPFHIIEISIYDKGKHEFKRGNKIISTKFGQSFQKKFKGDLPNLAQLQDL